MQLKDATGFFIDYGEKYGEPMTNMRLNKLLYFTYGTWLARTGERLFPERFEAWPFGPVIPAVYHRYKNFGDKAVVDPSAVFDRDAFTADEFELLLEVVSHYGSFVTSALVDMSHKTGGAWFQSIDQSVQDISDDLIRSEFLSRDPLVPLVSYVDPDTLPDTWGRYDGDDDWHEYDDC